MIYGLICEIRKLTTALGGTLHHTVFELEDSSPAEVDTAVATKVHAPTERLGTVTLELATGVVSVTVALALPAVKTVFVPGTAYILMRSTGALVELCTYVSHSRVTSPAKLFRREAVNIIIILNIFFICFFMFIYV